MWLFGDCLSIASAVTNLARLHIRARCDSVLRSIVVSLNLVFYSPKTFMGVLLQISGHDTSSKVSSREFLASIERRTLILLRRAMLKDCRAFERLLHTGLVSAVGHVRHC